MNKTPTLIYNMQQINAKIKNNVIFAFFLRKIHFLRLKTPKQQWNKDSV